MNLMQWQFELLKEIAQDEGEEEITYYKGAFFDVKVTHILTKEDAEAIKADVEGYRVHLRGQGEDGEGYDINECNLYAPLETVNDADIWKKLDSMKWESAELERLESVLPRRITRYRSVKLEVE